MADEIVERLAVELSLESENFKKKITAINSIIKNTEKEFKSAGNGVKNFENTFTGLDAKIQKTSKQLELYNLKLSKQKDEYEKNAKLVKEQKEKLDELEKTLGKNSTEWKEQAKLVQKNSQDLVKLGADIKTTESIIDKLSNELEEAKDKFNNLGNSTKTTEERLQSIDDNAKLTESTFNKLGSELVQSGNYFEKLGNEMNELTFKIDSGVQKITVYEDAIKQTSDILSKNKEEHKNLAKEINSTEEKLNKAKNEYGENSAEAQKLKSELLQLKDKYMDLENEIEDNSRALDGYQTELNNTQAEVNNLSQELRNLPFKTIGNDLKELGSTTKSIGQGLTTGVTVPIAGAGVAATVAGTNFGTAMSKLQATAGITDKTSESFKALEEKALEMGSSTSFSASEAAEGLTYLSLANWDVQTSIERIEPVLRAAEAGGMDLALTADDFTRYLNIAAQAQRKSNQSMQQLLEANIVAGGSFKMLNIPMEKSGALLGVLANRGIKGSEAGKALSSVFANLVTETGQAGEALDAMGISIFDANGKQRDMIEVLKELRGKLINTADGTSTLTEQQQAQYAAMLGGKTQFDTLMALLDGLGGEYDDLVVQLDNSTGALDEMARIMKDNLGGQIDSMKSAIEGALIKAFVALEPVLSKVVELITEAANWFSSLDEEQQKNIVVIAGVVAAIGPMLMGIGQLIIVGGNAVTLFGKLSSGATAASGAAGGLTSAAGILASPVGIGAIIAVLAALLAYIGDSETALLSLQEKFGGVGFIISSVCEFISGIVQMTFGNLAIAIMGICDIIAAIADGPGGLTVNEAWSRMTNKMTLNTEEAMSKITVTTSRGMSQMLNSTEESLIQLTTIMDTTLNQVPTIVAGNYSEASRVLASQLTNMSSGQLTTLKGMNDTTKMMFQGIRAGMTIDEAVGQVEKNLSQMSAAGKINGDSMTKDISSAMDQVNKQLSSKTGEASKEVSKNLDSAEKSVNESATDMQKGVTKEAYTMQKNASKSASDMKNNVTNSTSQMANKAINDWNRLQRTYSNPINGRVSVTRTTTERVVQGREATPAMYAVEEASNLRTRLSLPDVSRYVTQGSYYNYNEKSFKGIRKNENSSLSDVLNNLSDILDKFNIKSNGDLVLQAEIPVYIGAKEISREMTDIVIKKVTKKQNSINKGKGIE